MEERLPKEKKLNPSQLTREILAALIGGQMEIQNPGEGYLYRGEIKSIALDQQSKELKVEFVWVAKADGIPPRTWKKDDNLEYVANLEIYSVNNIGPSGREIGGGDRWSLHSSIVGETVVIYPPDGSKLDPAKVEGMELSPA